MMDKIAYFKDGIYDIATEKQALSLSSVVNAGKNLLNAGLGKKMAVGAAAGGIYGGLKAPGQGEDRLSNAVKGAFGGATTGVMAHGITKGLKSVKNTASVSAPAPTPAPVAPVPPPAPVPTNPMANVSSGIDWSKMNVDAGERINELYMEKLALFGLGKAAKNVVKPEIVDSLGNSARKFYNKNIAGGVVKNTVVGTGLGAAAGALKYDETKDDGSFERGRFGAMTSGALAGAGGGLASGLLFKKTPLKTMVPEKVVEKAKDVGSAVDNVVENFSKKAEFRDMVLDIAMEKKAASLPKTVYRGAVDIAHDFQKLDEVYRVAIGSGIGGTIGVINAMQSQKGKNIDTKEKIKEIGKAGFEAALIGAAIGGTIGYKPGQFKKDMEKAMK